MKFYLSGLQTVEVRAEVHARNMAEAVAKSKRASFDGWRVARADLYSVTDIRDAVDLDQYNAEYEMAQRKQEDEAAQLKQEALRDACPTGAHEAAENGDAG